jgi:hypothetical protein
MIPFEVSGSENAVALPSSSFVSLLFLGLGLLLVAATNMRRHVQSLFADAQSRNGIMAG